MKWADRDDRPIFAWRMMEAGARNGRETANSGRRRSLAAAIFAIVALLPAGGADGQTPAPPQKPSTPAAPPAQGTTQSFGSWALACPPPGGNGRCFLIQQVSETLSRKVVFVWLIQYDDKGQLLGAFRLPSGVFVNKGLIMKTDSKSEGLRVEYTRCDPAECQAVFSISAELAKQFVAAKSVTVDVALTSGRVANVQLGMEGFAAAMNALASRGKPSGQ
jgi:invasion protein IalB